MTLTQRTVFSILLLLLTPLARADDALSGISVIGAATAKARPTIVEIAATITGDADQAGDARIKERDARQRAIDALEAAKIPSVSVESRGFTISQAFDNTAQQMQARLLAQQQIAIQQGVIIQLPNNAGVDIPRRYTVAEQVRVVLKDADKLDSPKLMETVLRIVDLARDSGLQMGQSAANPASLQMQPTTPSPLIVYRIPDCASLRETAYKAALEDARQKAAQLAQLSGLKVGRILALQEQDASAARDADAGLSSTTLGDLSLNVRLAVQFEVAK